MKRQKGPSAYALPAFLAVTGGVLAVIVAVFSLRELITPRTQVWTVWTNTAMAMLGLVAIALWVAGAWIASRMHRNVAIARTHFSPARSGRAWSTR
jgi:hypothetical protein